MTITKESSFHIDKFIRSLKKKNADVQSQKAENFKVYEQMVVVKDYLGTVYNNDEIPPVERAKIFIEKMKSLEVLGEKYDNGVKKMSDLDHRSNLDFEILIKNVSQVENKPFDDVRNYILQYIETNNDPN